MPNPDLPATGLPATSLAAWLGHPERPALYDVCLPEDAADLGRAIPGSLHVPHTDVPKGGPALVICAQGKKLSQGAAAQLRAQGIPASHLIGGLQGWIDGGYPSLSRSPGARFCAALEAFPEAAFLRWFAERMLPDRPTLLAVPAASLADVGHRFDALPWESPAHALRTTGATDPSLKALLDMLQAAPFTRLLDGVTRLYGADEAGQRAALPLFDAAYGGARP